MNETISVAELAKRAGVSRQAIYNRLTKDLKKFTKVIDGKKRLDIAVLEYLNIEKIDKKVDNKSSDINITVKILTNELEIKNTQIEHLQTQVTQLTEALQNTTNSLIAAQALHASSVKQLADGNDNNIPVPDKEKKSFFNFFKKKVEK